MKLSVLAANNILFLITLAEANIVHEFGNLGKIDHAVISLDRTGCGATLHKDLIQISCSDIGTLVDSVKTFEQKKVKEEELAMVIKGWHPSYFPKTFVKKLLQDRETDVKFAVSKL